VKLFTWAAQGGVRVQLAHSSAQLQGQNPEKPYGYWVVEAHTLAHNHYPLYLPHTPSLLREGCASEVYGKEKKRKDARW